MTVKNLSYMLTALLCLFFSYSSFSAIDAYEFDSDEKAQQFRELTLQLRCPKCQNNSIADSNAVIAADMRAKVYELMGQDYTDQQVIDYMIDRYGNFVTYSPPINKVTLMLWIVPILFLISGAVALVILAGRRKSASVVDIDRLTQEEQVRLKQILASKNDDPQQNGGG